MNDKTCKFDEDLWGLNEQKYKKYNVAYIHPQTRRYTIQKNITHGLIC